MLFIYICLLVFGCRQHRGLVLCSQIRRTYNVKQWCCSFKGRDAWPVIHLEGCGQMWLVAW